MANEEAERQALEKAVESMVKKEFNGLEVAVGIKREYAALSELTRAAIRAAARAINHSELRDAEGKDRLIADFALQLVRLTVRRQDEMPQILMMPQTPQNPPFNPFGNIPGLS